MPEATPTATRFYMALRKSKSHAFRRMYRWMKCHDVWLTIFSSISIYICLWCTPTLTHSACLIYWCDNLSIRIYENSFDALHILSSNVLIEYWYDCDICTLLGWLWMQCYERISQFSGDVARIKRKERKRKGISAQGHFTVKLANMKSIFYLFQQNTNDMLISMPQIRCHSEYEFANIRCPLWMNMCDK